MEGTVENSVSKDTLSKALAKFFLNQLSLEQLLAFQSSCELDGDLKDEIIADIWEEYHSLQSN